MSISFEYCDLANQKKRLGKNLSNGENVLVIRNKGSRGEVETIKTALNTYILGHSYLNKDEAEHRQFFCTGQVKIEESLDGSVYVIICKDVDVKRFTYGMEEHNPKAFTYKEVPADDIIEAVDILYDEVCKPGM